MTPDRLERIEELYHAALKRPAENRSEFLTAACGDDQELRRQIESFLIHAESDGSLLEKPAWGVLPAASVAIEPGALIGPYRIITCIGSGGMGRVYRAEDTRLRRTVAIKFLHSGLAADPSARQRFQREAQA